MKTVKRIKYGNESINRRFKTLELGLPCHDCGAVKGDYHQSSCDAEECPVCGGQLLICGCGVNEHNVQMIYGDVMKVKEKVKV